MELDEKYWSARYADNQVQWDVGNITTPLKCYFDQLKDKSLKILIPGAGNAYEAEYLFANGFEQVYIADLSKLPLDNFVQRNSGFPAKNLLHHDFFDLKGEYDLIVEQTFFCALDPNLRADYARQMHNLLREGGKLVGLLFNDLLYKDHPPFGGTKSEYEGYFKPYFNFKYFDVAYNSVAPRKGREFFICMEKENQNSST